MRIQVFAADLVKSGRLASALAARGYEVLLVPADGPSSASDPRPVDLIVADVAVPPASVTAVRTASGRALPLVLSVRRGGSVPADWFALGPLDVVPVDADGAPVDSPAALDVRVRAAADAWAHRERARCALLSFEGSAAPTCLLDGTGRIECANAAFARLLERSPTETAPTRLADAVDAPAEGTPEATFVKALVTSRSFEGEVRLTGSRGRRVVCHVALAPLAGREGSVAVLVDVTRRVTEETALRDANRRLAEVASTDPLSGLHNRAFLQNALDREVARWRRYGQPFALLMVDLDDFKRVNDEHGHDVGDDVLRAVAGALLEGLRDGDVLARYGGDEFCAILPSADLPSATLVADRVLARVASVSVAGEHAVRLGASIGIALTSDLAEDDGAADLIRLADRAMLAAKRQGGHRWFHGRLAPSGDAGPRPSGPTSSSRRTAS